MALDTDTATLLAAVTLTGGTITSAHNGENMSGYCMSAVVSSGSFTAGMYAVLQSSIDNTNFANITDSTQTISAIGPYIWNVNAPFYNYVRVGFTLPSGNIAVKVDIRTVGTR